MKRLYGFLLFMVVSRVWAQAPQFTVQPSLTNEGGKWVARFGLDKLVDVEVLIVAKTDSTVVRHLAAGLLGANAPEPLLKDSLTQRLEWDGKNDDGIVIGNPGDMTLRIRAGMGVRYMTSAAGSPYSFWNQNGLYVAPDGYLYIYGQSNGNKSMALRQYDGDGNYIKTVFPWPAKQAETQVSGFGIHSWLNGKITPVTTRLFGPIITQLPINESNVLLPFGRAGELVLGSLGNNTITRLSASGSVASTGMTLPFVTSPAYMGPYDGISGPVCVKPSRTGDFALLSGIYRGKGSDPIVVDTGFWQDGRVYKVDMNTGVATLFLALDSVPKTIAARMPKIGPQYGGVGYQTCAAVHGTASDDSGRVFICDRMHGQIGVYGSTGSFIRAVPVAYPDLVEVNPSTGELYVITRILSGYHSGAIRLFKFPDWRTASAPLCSLTLMTSNMVETGDGIASMGVSFSAVKPMVWISYTGWGTKAYRDDGAVLTLAKDMAAVKAVISVDRIAVDRKNERVYFNDAWSGIYQIGDWNTAAVLACSSTTGRIYGADMCVSPTGYLYVREGQSYNGSVTRYTLDHRHAPAPFANTGSHVMTPYIYSRMHGTGGYGERGFDVNREGELAIEYMYTFGPYFIGMLGDSGQLCTGETTGVVDTIIKPIDGYYSNCGGVKFDTKGNLYMGMKGKPVGFEVPDPFKNDDTYNRGVGVVARYPAGGKGSVAYNAGVMTFPGADKVYMTPLSPFSSAWGECACRTPRFDVDLFGRLYLPDALSNQVRVLDNAGNVLLTFGEYGNWDSQGPGSLVPTADVPLGWPVGAAATDDYLYVADMINSRVVRTEKTFALDNMPGTSSGVVGSAGVRCNVPLRMTAIPNPCNPAAQIILNLPETMNASLAVYDTRGRLVKMLLKGSMTRGTHRIAFDGIGLTSGLYVARFAGNGKTVESRIMLVK